MKSLIVYASHTRLSPEQSLVETRSGALYIRAEEADGTPLEALDQAQPRHGETVLNTIPLPMVEATA